MSQDNILHPNFRASETDEPLALETVEDVVYVIEHEPLHPAPTRQTYSLHLFDDKATMLHTSGVFIEDTEMLRKAAKSLLETAAAVDKKRKKHASYTMIDFRKEHAQTAMAAILEDEDTFWEFYTQDGDRQLNNLSGPCVYFARSHSDYRETIKIGYTKGRISDRMSQIQAAYKITDTPYAAAVVRVKNTAMARDLEYWLHLYFASYRVVGEWFKAEPVFWFINFCRTLEEQE
jgi:hypothetical protein